MDINCNGKNLPECVICYERSTMCCGSCGDVWYCSKEHKRLDWEDHYGECKPYKVKHSAALGQHLEASRSIKAGTLICKEEPTAVGPLGTSELICLSCYAPIFEDNFFKCPDCFWPMCNAKCAEASVHELECQVLEMDKKHCGVPLTQGETPRYDLIIVLRCLLLKKTNPKMWNLVLSMASHGLKLRDKKDPHQIAALRYFKEVCKLDHTEEEIHLVRGVILANVMKIRSENGTQVRGLYACARIMNHSCVPNVQLSATMDLSLEARTVVDIEKGEELTICYTGTDTPIWERQACLLDNHYFNCLCKRCSDPYELGANFSSPRCLQCPQIIMNQIVHDGKINWICCKCRATTSVEEITQEIEDWIFRLEMNELFGTGSPSKVSHALALIEQHFHIKHYMWLMAAQKALQKIKHNKTFSAIKLKRYIWEKMLDIYDIIEPGFTRRRGMILSQLANTMHALSSDEFVIQDETSKQQAEGYLMEAKGLYEESYKILRIEPPGTPENKLSEFLMRMASQIIDKLDDKNNNINGLNEKDYLNNNLPKST